MNLKTVMMWDFIVCGMTGAGSFVGFLVLFGGRAGGWDLVFLLCNMFFCHTNWTNGRRKLALLQPIPTTDERSPPQSG